MEENIKILESHINQLKEFEDEQELVLALENLIKGYRELKEGCKTCVIRDDLHEYVENSIPKSKIKEKIEEIKNKFGSVNGWDSEFNYAIEVLQELMEDK